MTALIPNAGALKACHRAFVHRHPATPELGDAEFAGWVPGGRQMLVARESRNAKGLKRNFEVVRIESLATDRQAGDPSRLGPFQRWQDPAWKRDTVSLR